jgi:serine/threonine-protein kinase RsbW
MIKYLPRKSVRELSHGEELAAWETPSRKTASPSRRRSGLPIPSVFRAPGPVEVARCAYRAYGYSYPNPHIFFPDRVVDLNARGSLVSALAVTPEGDFRACRARSAFRRGRGPRRDRHGFCQPAYRGQGCLHDLPPFFSTRRVRELRRSVRPVRDHPSGFPEGARSVGFASADSSSVPTPRP